MEHLPDLYSSLFSLTFIFSNHKYWLVLFQIDKKVFDNDSRLLTVSIFVYIRLNSNIYVCFRIVKHHQSNSRFLLSIRTWILLLQLEYGCAGINWIILKILGKNPSHAIRKIPSLGIRKVQFRELRQLSAFSHQFLRRFSAKNVQNSVWQWI